MSARVLSWLAPVRGRAGAKRLRGGIPLGKYRIFEWFSSGGNYSRLRTAKIEGYLTGNRDFCSQQAAEIHPLMGREHCAVFP